MENLTLKEAFDNHKVLWNWLADETLKRKRKVSKSEYFEEQGIVDDLLFNCYCCEYSIKNYDWSCKNCILDWGSSKVCGALLNRWLSAPNYIIAAELARQIANLPLKPKYLEQYKMECGESKYKQILDSYKESMMQKFMKVI